MGGKKSGFSHFMNNQRAVELVEAYFSGQINTQGDLHRQLIGANIKISLRTVKEYLKLAQMRRPPKRRRARRLAQNGQNNGEENGGEEEEEGEGEEWEVEEGAEIDSINADDVGIGPDDFNNFDGTTNGGGGGLMVATTSSHFFNDEMKPPMATVTAFEVVHHSNVKEGAEEKMLDAALEWIMADGGALNVLNSAAFQTFFKATCQIQIEQLSRGNKKALALPDVNEIGEAMDRHLAKIECQKRALDEKQSRIMGLRRTLMMEDGENGDGEEQRKREAELS